MHHPEIKPQNLQVIWNVQFITVFVPAWMIPPVYHSLRRTFPHASGMATTHRWCRPAMLYSSICNPPRTRRHVKRIRHEKRFSRNKSERTPMVSQRSVEPKIHGTEDRIHSAATLGWLRAGHWAEIFPFLWSQRWWHPCSSRYRRPAVLHAAWQSFILALGTPAAQNVPPQTGTLAQRALEEWECTLYENKAVAILAQMQAGRPALIQKDGGEMLIAIVLDRPLADAKALVDDPAAFTREMTKILLEKQSHPLIAQMIKPAGSSDPPPSNSAASSTGSHEHPSAGTPVQFQNLNG